MNAPKYQTGQNVYFVASAVKRGAPASAHRVERLMPADDGRRNIGRQYRLKAVDTGRERIAREDELSARATVGTPASPPRESGTATARTGTVRAETFRTDAFRTDAFRTDRAPADAPWAQPDRSARDSWFKDALATLARDGGEA